ncbi:PEP-CTERM sorting domain-containing protein [Candidatus Omnitrophota bacterium]
MKKMLMVCGFVAALLFSTGESHAFMVIDTVATGQLRERIDLCGYGCGPVPMDTSSYPKTVSLLGLKFAGGPVANNSVGYAQQFNILQETEVDYLLISAHIAQGQNSFPQFSSHTMYFKLYTETLHTFRGDPSPPYPDAATAALVSSLFVTTHLEDRYVPALDAWRPFEVDGQYTDVPIPFNMTLAPGTYWIAQERYAENTGGLFGQLAYGKGSGARVDGISVKFAATPEPATLFLFASGLAGAFFMRRRVNKREKGAAHR